MKNTPQSVWPKVNLFEICNPKQWKTISTKDLTPSGYHVYGANGIIGFYDKFTHEKPTLLITCRGASCGNLHISKPFSYVNGNAMALDDLAEDFCNKKFLYRYLQSRGFADVISGSAQPQITREGLAKVDVPLPSIAHQNRIADKLNTVLTRVDAVQNRLARITPLLKRFRQSILAAATSGRLTEEWRGYKEFVAPELLLGKIGKVSGGLTKNSKRNDLPLKVKYLRVANVHANELRLDEILEIGVSDEEFKKTKLEANDLLIVEGNGSIEQIGRVSIWNEEVKDCCHQNHLIRWRGNNLINPKFVLNYFLSPIGRKKIVAVASSTTGLHTLSVSKVGALTLEVPSLEEQTEIVSRVELLMGYADRLEARLQAAQTAAERLTPALLAKAFRGELVPQDPNDEPAAELLRRLREARAAQAPAKPKRGRKAAMT